MLPERSSNASALVQSKSQVRRPLRYGATGVQSHPILVTVTACRLLPTSAPKRRPAIDPKRVLQHCFTPTREIPRQFCLLVLPGWKRAGVTVNGLPPAPYRISPGENLLGRFLPRINFTRTNSPPSIEL